MNMRQYFVYIMTNRSRTLYTGVTNNLERRVQEHRSKLVPGFSQRHNITQPVYWEEYRDVRDAIAREKKIKGWLRSNEIALIESVNPHWDDLGNDSCTPANRGKSNASLASVHQHAVVASASARDRMGDDRCHVERGETSRLSGPLHTSSEGSSLRSE
jgi:putative endonuclease